MPRRSLAGPLVIVGLAVAAPTAAAQIAEDAPGALPPSPSMAAEEGDPSSGKGPDVTWFVDAGTAYQFDTDLESGGSVAQTRAVIGAAGGFRLAPNLSLRLNLGYQFDSFDFGTGSVLGPAPWSSVHTLGFGAAVHWNVTERWTIGGGPVLQLSGEADADVEDTITGGGIVTVSYRFSDDLVLGAGVILTTQLEDDFQAFPIPIVEWRINDQLRLSSSSGPTAILRGGGEIIWSPLDEIDVAFGARYEKLRFRLDDSGPTADGVGQQRSVPLWVRLGWRPSQTVSLGVFGGVRVGGELRLEDSNGDRVAEDDLDPAPMIGVYGALRF